MLYAGVRGCTQEQAGGALKYNKTDFQKTRKQTWKL